MRSFLTSDSIASGAWTREPDPSLLHDPQPLLREEKQELPFCV